MSDFETPEQVAADIAQMYIEDEARWTRCVWAQNADGRNVLPTSPEAVCWCLRGAIDARLPPIPLRGIDIPRYHARNRLATETYRAFDKALGVEHDEYSHSLYFVRWNDDGHRTVSDVIGLCQKVAKIGEGFAAFRAAAQ